jgi:hypothetical protein
MSERNRAFALFILGAMLFASAFALPIDLVPDDKALLFTPLFGLPYLLRELGRKIRWATILYLALLVPAYHFAAHMIAVVVWSETGGHPLAETGVGRAWLLAGLAGGFVGAALSLLTLRLGGLRADGATLAPAIAGILVLTALGGFGLTMARTPEDSLFWLYLPWQIVLGFFISRLLRPSPPRRDAGR